MPFWSARGDSGTRSNTSADSLHADLDPLFKSQGPSVKSATQDSRVLEGSCERSCSDGFANVAAEREAARAGEVGAKQNPK